MKKKWRLKILLAVALAASVLFAFRISDKYFEIAKSLDIMAAAYRDLNEFYVDSLNPSKLMEAGIESMAQSLDPYTWYYPKEDLNSLDFETTGQYGGVGISIQKVHDSIQISDVFENAPFAKAGIHTGDYILSINDRQVSDLTMDEMADLLKGIPGSILETKILQAGSHKITDYKIKREEVNIPAVTYSGFAAPGIGFIKIGQFTTGTADEVRDALTDLKKQSPDLKGIIIDLRGNPGGLVLESLETANLFLPQGDTLMSTRGRAPQSNVIYTAAQTPIEPDVPLAVLINHGSASASEILAGAIQDLDRGVIIGQRSFGKGLVQTTRDLPYDGKIKFTVARYYTPSGRCIQAIDYSHDNNFGDVTLIPDSLKENYRTKDGRIVRNAGGIEPDKITHKPTMSTIAGSLIVGNYIFNFATQYYYAHPTPPALGNFRLTEKDFNRFVQYLQEVHFTYQTDAESALENFRDVAKQEGSFKSVQSNYEKLYGQLKQFQDQELQNHKKEIMQLLSDEIMSRYYFQRGRIAEQLPADKTVQTAVDLLDDSLQYHHLLNN